MESVSATEARVHFGELLRRVVTTNQPVVVERSGEPQVVMMAVDEYKRLTGVGGAGAAWEAQVGHVHALIRKDMRGRKMPPAEQLIQEGREERDATFFALR
jgi:prevent-host-death family protein